MISFNLITSALRIDIKYTKEFINWAIKHILSAYTKILEVKHHNLQPDLNIFSIMESIYKSK